MKKVLCDKDGKFLFVHDGDCTLAEFKDGDYLTHEDGTITIYRENECKKIFLKYLITFIYAIMNYIFFKLECHFLTMIIFHLTDSLRKKKRKS